MKQYGALDDVFYLWFAGNDTSGSGGDGASPAADVRLAGAAADAAPVYSPTPSLLSHVDYPAGAYEIAIVASAANGFATGNTYAVFCTLAIDSQNPTGFIGSFDLKPVTSDIRSVYSSASAAGNLYDFSTNGYDSISHKSEGVKLADTVTANTDMRGTDSAALASALTTHDGKLDTADALIDTLIARLTAARAGYLDNLSAGAVALAATALTDVTWTDAKAAFLDHSIATVDGIVDAILLDTGTDGVVVASGSKTGYALASTGADLILKDSTFALAIADAIWDEILTGATHNIATSAGRRVREIAGIAIHSGTAQAGASTTITLDTGANGGNGVYNRNLIVILAGTGEGQTRTIVDYDDTTKVCIIDREWRITPDATSEFQILADDTPLVVDHGVAQGGTSTTLTLRDYASAVNNI